MSLKIEHRLGVRAPAAVIWEILYDVGDWPRWSEIYQQAAGAIGFGAALTLTEALPGEAPRVIRPTILDWAPNEAIHWRLTSLGGLVSSVRYFEIEALSDTGCIVSNGEIHGGLLGPRLAAGRRRALREGFTRLGEALRDRAEAAWRQHPRGAT